MLLESFYSLRETPSRYIVFKVLKRLIHVICETNTHDLNLSAFFLTSRNLLLAYLYEKPLKISVSLFMIQDSPGFLLFSRAGVHSTITAEEQSWSCLNHCPLHLVGRSQDGTLLRLRLLSLLVEHNSFVCFERLDDPPECYTFYIA